MRLNLTTKTIRALGLSPPRRLLSTGDPTSRAPHPTLRPGHGSQGSPPHSTPPARPWQRRTVPVSRPVQDTVRTAMTGDASWHVIVVVPARDEASSIERCIRSVLRARRLVISRAFVDVIVVADACTDDTEIRASRLLTRVGAVVSIASGCVGEARRAGTGLGIRRSSSPLERTWIASTDADSVVPADWLKQHLCLADDGAAGVAGIVRLAPPTSSSGPLRAAFRASYGIRADGTHDHVHGANLGCRADAYLDVGGWTGSRTGEDHDLWCRLRRAYPTVSSASSLVWTSARTSGRAPAGFAADIARLHSANGGTAR